MTFKPFTPDELKCTAPILLIATLSEQLSRTNQALMAVNEECRQLHAELSQIEHGNNTMRGDNPSTKN